MSLLKLWPAKRTRPRQTRVFGDGQLRKAALSLHGEAVVKTRLYFKQKKKTHDEFCVMANKEQHYWVSYIITMTSHQSESNAKNIV